MNAPVAIKTEAEQGLASAFAAAQPTLPGGPGVSAARLAAFEAFNRVGLPHRRVEAWKYTDLRRLMRDAKPLAPLPDAAAKAEAGSAGALLAGLGLRRLVVVDGSFAPELSDLADLEPGLTIRPMAEVFGEDGPLLPDSLRDALPDVEPALALNAAFARDGVFIGVAPGAVVARPIHVAFITTGDTPQAVFSRSRVVLGVEAQLALVETHEAKAGVEHQVNVALGLLVGDKAQLDHVKVTGEGSAVLHVGSLVASVGAQARFGSCGFTLGGATVRNQLYVRLVGETTELNLAGASLLGGKQHADTALFLTHAAPGSTSREVFKAVVDDKAEAAFQGRITVEQAAQQTDARMMSRALLLSEEAEAYSKPELEIFADDVQCGHGATVGTLDEQLKFYLMARGIPAKEAEALLIQAFIGEVLDGIAHEGVREALTAATVSWLEARGA
ncbi:iron-regulated ABC transporter permease protein SufD [Azorhizobium sp. AG788]|uniref:Fe-S cluster assembly protein SufD n=1 Tax=Azorhizobium sp. AG788 TaxID=2183897 RepID=UPI001061CB4A|nr:Fe-S cluster assembly protein SufD [Azorhizobium sp. AG788]TDT92751.1 iron-regulated ABC transporter permease protein SufD [Azorhizobium sp. AG788]